MKKLFGKYIVPTRENSGGAIFTGVDLVNIFEFTLKLLTREEVTRLASYAATFAN